MIKANGKVIQLNKKNKNLLVHLFNQSNYSNRNIKHFVENSDNCIVRFIPKSILDTFNERIEIQKRELNGSDGVSAENFVYGGLFTNSLWDSFTYNVISYSPFNLESISNNMGHYSFRGKTWLFDLLNPDALATLNIYNDICIHSYERVENLDFLSDFISINEDYFLVITHGYVLYEDYNKGVKTENYNLFDSIIPFDIYKRDYLYRMSTPLHIYNGVTHGDFLRLSFIATMGYLTSFENNFNPFILNGSLFRLMSTLKGEYNSKINKNPKLFEKKKSLRLLVPNPNNICNINKITLDIDKNGVNINSITDFNYPNISKIATLSHDVSENFIHDNLSNLPTLSYGLSGILDSILKDYTRSCCDGISIERGIIHLDLNDLLDICNPLMNGEINRNIKNGKLTNTFYDDWKCLELLDIVKELCEGSPISFNQLKSDFSEIVNNIENNLNTIPEGEHFKYKSIPFVLLFSFVLYRLTGRLNGTYKEKLLKYHPNIEISTNGIFNYTSTIDNYIKTGVVELENKCPKNIQKMEKEYDLGDFEGFSFFGNDLIHDFEEKSESLISKDNGFDSDELNEFGKIDFSESVEKAKSLDKSDFEVSFNENPKDILSVFGEECKEDKDDEIRDVSDLDLNGLFGTKVGLDLSYEGDVETKETDGQKIKEETDFGMNSSSETFTDDFFNDAKLNAFGEFDSGLSDFFKTSPYFDKNTELRDILIEDIFNPGLDYSVTQIKSLITRDGITMDTFRKELLHRVLEKINADDSIFDVYTALIKMF